MSWTRRCFILVFLSFSANAGDFDVSNADIGASIKKDPKELKVILSERDAPFSSKQKRAGAWIELAGAGGAVGEIGAGLAAFKRGDYHNAVLYGGKGISDLVKSFTNIYTVIADSQMPDSRSALSAWAVTVAQYLLSDPSAKTLNRIGASFDTIDSFVTWRISKSIKPKEMAASPYEGALLSVGKEATLLKAAHSGVTPLAEIKDTVREAQAQPQSQVQAQNAP